MRSGAGLALVLVATAAAGEPREPLTVTKLADSESELLVSTDSSAADRNVDEFSQAVSEAVRTQQQSIQTQCQSANRAADPMAARWMWAARCRYRRY